MTSQTVSTVALPDERSGWWESLHGRHGLVADAAAFVLNTGATGGLGFLFWILAARLYRPDAVGVSSAVISMMYLIGNVSRLGLDVALARRIPAVGDRRLRAGLITVGLSVVAIVGMLTAALFLLQLPLVEAVTAPLRRSPTVCLFFIATCSAYGVSLVLDQVLLVSGLGQHMVWKNSLMSGVRLMALPLTLVSGQRLGIFVATAIGLIFALTFVGYHLRTMFTWSADSLAAGVQEIRSSLAKYALGNYFSALVAGLPGWLLPVVIIRQESTRAAAYFYASWMIATVMNTIPSALATGFFMESARRGRWSGRLLRNVYLYTLLWVIPASLILFLGASRILTEFRPAYAAAATPLLRYFALANIPLALTQIYTTQLQLRRKLLALGFINVMCTSVALSGSYLLVPAMGLAGVGGVWLVASLCQALAAGLHASSGHARWAEGGE